MKRIQLSGIVVIIIMAMLISVNHSGFFSTDSFLDFVPTIEAVQYDVYDEDMKSETTTTTFTTTRKETTTTTTRKETTTTTTVTRKETTTTTVETTTTTVETTTVTEEVTPVAIEETFNENVPLEENNESNLYSIGERTVVEKTEVEKSNNRAEWYEEWLPEFSTSITYTDQDFQTLCNVVQHEVGGCTARSKYIVASVVINRVIQGWGASIWDVVTAPNQFSGVWSYVEDSNYAMQDTIDCVNYVLNNNIDFADGATSFYNPSYCGYMSWFENQELIAEYEGHRYFR